jgi:hypothetical protein
MALHGHYKKNFCEIIHLADKWVDYSLNRMYEFFPMSDFTSSSDDYLDVFRLVSQTVIK